MPVTDNDQLEGSNGMNSGAGGVPRALFDQLRTEIGSGRADDGEKAKEETVATQHRKPYRELLDDDKQVWQDTPSYLNQYELYPETVRKVGPNVKIFDLSDPEQLDAYNTLLNGMQNPKAPRCLVETLELMEVPAKENWKLLCRVVYFRYLKIIET